MFCWPYLGPRQVHAAIRYAAGARSVDESRSPDTRPENAGAADEEIKGNLKPNVSTRSRTLKLDKVL